MHRPAALRQARWRRLVRAAAAVVPTLAALAGVTRPASAQYFGRNKVNYQTFNFRTLKTPHFDVLYYPYEEEAARDGGRMAERWYARYSPFMRHTFQRKTIIFFSDQSDFQQNNVTDIEGENTGGVTESFRQRVIMPFTGVYADNNHVLGHELVHVFQYDIANATPGAQQGLNTLPLWLIEGMAEYLSLGRSDVNTATWLRDAARRNDVPTIKQLTNDQRYFPYRYGQALWAYVGGRYGDQAVVDVYRASLRYGFESAIRRTLDVSTDQLSKDWKASIQGAYLPLIAGRTIPEQTGQRVIGQQNKRGGDLNIGPVVSPDGRTVAFYSSRALFDIFIYLADAQTGKVITQLGSINSARHFDALSFLNTTGTFSPDGRRFAYVVYKDGNQVVSVYDIDHRRTERTLKTPGIGAALDPSWSPDGRTLAFVGQVGGISDLYLYDLASDRITRLTNDRYANLQPAWSPDGRSLAFVTDQGPGTDFDRMTFAPTRIGIMDVATRQVRVVDGFPGARHINPQFTPDGRSLYYVSDPDGFSDLYRQDLTTGQRYRVTRTATGITGVTNLSPAISVARQTGRVLFSVFDHQGYDLARLEAADAQGTPVPATNAAPAVAASGSATGGTTNAIVSTNTAVTAANHAISAAARDTTPAGVADAVAAGAGGVLPPAQPGRSSTIEGYLAEANIGLPRADTTFASTKLVPRLSLDYVAPPQIGVGYNSYFGGGVTGGVAAFFSDQLGNQNLIGVIQAQGQLADIGGQVQYINTKHRWNWGGGIGHVPTPFGTAYITQSQTGYDYNQIIGRVTLDQVYGLTQYPLNAAQRFEFTGGLNRQYVSGRNYITNLDPTGNYVVGQSTQKLTGLGPTYSYAQLSAAFVGDYSVFGLTSPVAGGRYRFEVTPSFGDLHFVQATADYRRYLYFRPVTFAMRGLHIGRYGGNSNINSNVDSIFGPNSYFAPGSAQPYYIGLPTLVRGYDLFNQNDLTRDCPATTTTLGTCPAISRLVGNRIAVASAEFRIPILAPAGLGLINTNILPVDLVPFADVGLAWAGGRTPKFKFLTGNAAFNTPGSYPIASTGVSTRINVLGFAVAEVFYAHAFQRPGKPNNVGFVLSPGW